MRLSPLKDKLGIGSIFFGVDGLFIHTDMTDWIGDSLPELLRKCLMAAIALAGLYLLLRAGQSNSADPEAASVDERLQERKATAGRVRKYHWYILIALIFGVNYLGKNWEEGAGLAMSFFILLLWLTVVWPVVHFWAKRYTDRAEVPDFEKLRDRAQMIEYLFVIAKGQSGKAMHVMLLMMVILPIVSLAFPGFIGQKDPIEAFFNTFLFVGFMTIMVWIFKPYGKRRIRRLHAYLQKNPGAKVWAYEEDDDAMALSVDGKILKVAKVFLPMDMERCIEIINEPEMGEDIVRIPDASEENGWQSDGKSDTDTVQETADDTGQEGAETDAPEVEGGGEWPPPEFVNERKYKPDGYVKHGRFALLTTLMLPLGLLAAFAYGYLSWYIPIPYVKFFITAGFGWAIGWLIPVRWGKCTDSGIALLYCFIFMFVVHYFSWVTWLDLYANRGDEIEINYARSPVSSIVPSITHADELLRLSGKPGVVFRAARNIAKHGYFSFFTLTPKGFILELIWVAEFLLALLVAISMAITRADKPFNTKRRKWYPSIRLSLGHVNDPLALIRAIEADDAGPFSGLSERQPDTHYSEHILWHMEGEPSYLTVKNMVRTVDKKGKIEFKETLLFEQIRIGDAVSGQLLSRKGA